MPNRKDPKRESSDRALPEEQGAGLDLGFTYHWRNGREVEVLHDGRHAVTLRGAAARDFLADVESCQPSDAQQLMARLTGNFKRGNERLARAHPRNRGR